MYFKVVYETLTLLCVATSWYSPLHNWNTRKICYGMPNILIKKPKPLLTKISSYNNYEHKELKLHRVGNFQIRSCCASNDSKTPQLGGNATKSDKKGVGWHPIITTLP